MKGAGRGKDQPLNQEIHPMHRTAPRDHYTEITPKIIAALEAGAPPWRCG
jgi:antirestriction protein ArdC